MERTRIIVADDESIVRADLKEMLTSLGYLVVGEAGDGQSAVNLAREDLRFRGEDRRDFGTPVLYTLIPRLFELPQLLYKAAE